jgi:hypothetical protein
MEDFQHPVERFSPPAFAIETTYWKIDRRRLRRRHNVFIFAFNIGNEMFQTITHAAY